MAWAARTVREGRDSDTRELLLDCAARVFARLGYAHTTIADIATEAELGRATFYVYFASKAAVFLAVANRVRDEVLAVHELPAAGYLRARVDNRDLLTVIGHQALDDAQVAAIWQDIRDRPVDRTARHIRHLVEQGKANPAASAVAIAHATYGIADRFAELVAAKPALFNQKAAELAAIYRRLLGVDR